MEKIKLILSGASGRLCSVIAALSLTRDDCCVIGGIDISGKSAAFPVYDAFDKVPDEICSAADVLIDCSHHTAAPDIVRFILKNHLPAVICTTGHTDEEECMISEAAQVVPILKSRNMSLGINLLSELVKRAASVLGEDFDIEVVEAHHRNKLDAPSGTALMLADAARDARREQGIDSEYIYERASRRKPRGNDEIGISSVRCGTIVGDHSVIFAGEDEVITLSHSAGSRDLFAIGAIRAAVFIADKHAGYYTMSDVIRSIY